MRTVIGWVSIPVVFVGVVAANLAVADVDDEVAEPPKAHPYAAMQGAEIDVVKLTESWPQKARAQALKLVEQYGAPVEATPRMVAWDHAGPWKRLAVFTDERIHDFPRPHADVLEAVIDYKVPVDKVDDLVAFDGSLTVARTAGELAVRCEDERVAYLAMNLAHEVATGAKEVEDARRAYTDALVSLLKKEEPPASTRKLAFAVGEETADPDVVMKMRASAK